MRFLAYSRGPVAVPTIDYFEMASAVVVITALDVA
jgi:hypothetical protein